jgi:hypothetical protein
MGNVPLEPPPWYLSPPECNFFYAFSVPEFVFFSSTGFDWVKPVLLSDFFLFFSFSVCLLKISQDLLTYFSTRLGYKNHIWCVIEVSNIFLLYVPYMIEEMSPPPFPTHTVDANESINFIYSLQVPFGLSYVLWANW